MNLSSNTAFWVAILSFLAAATAQTSTAVTTTVNPSTTTGNASSFATTININVEGLWDLFVGPVTEAAITTTAPATSVPSSSLIPPPPLYYSPFPRGQQVPLQTLNSSWKWPANFWWGVASAAYQVEGAAKAEGRGPSIWDVLTHRVTDYTTANQTGDITDNQYYLYKQDIARLAAIGVHHYSISISWSRILPFGRGSVNEEALAHYDDLIDTCFKYNVTPTITLYHWDTPLYLQNLYGGWLSSEIVEDFVNYAQIIFSRYGNRIQTWFTVNEPSVFCSFYPLPVGYFTATTIPAQQQPYFCGQNVLLAHSAAYHLGKSLGLNGSISLKLNGGYKIPLTSSAADARAVQRAWDFTEGWWAHPIFITGDYPATLKQYVSSFLPPFTAAQKKQINGTADFLAHDAYTSQFYFAPDAGIDACINDPTNPLYPSCANTSYTYSKQDGGWLIGPAAAVGAPWLHKATDWVPAFLHYLEDTYKPRGGIAITEFGFAEPYEELKTNLADILYDPIRMSYYHDYLEAVLMAISEGVNVVGALAWSIFDNLEWTSGFTTKFGMQYVNFTTQERYYKASFFEYVRMFHDYGA